MFPTLTTALPPHRPLRRNVALTVRAMNTPEDAKYLFAEAQAALTPVVGAPNNNDVKRLNEAFINALQ